MPEDSAAVVVAAGSGRRLGAGNKALLPLAGEPLLAHVLRTLGACPDVGEVVVVMNDDDVERLRDRWHATPQAWGADQVVPGGAERWQSSAQGCRAVGEAARWILVHDCARPLVGAGDVAAVLAEARAHGAALLAAPLTDTLKRADARGRVLETVPREGLWRAQTPQCARRDWLLEAFEAWPAGADAPTDEAMLLEAAGHPPQVVAARAPNPKITTRDDLALAEALLAARSGSHA